MLMKSKKSAGKYEFAACIGLSYSRGYEVTRRHFRNSKLGFENGSVVSSQERFNRPTFFCPMKLEHHFFETIFAAVLVSVQIIYQENCECIRSIILDPI